MPELDDYDADLDTADEDETPAPPAEKPGWRKRIENDRDKAKAERDDLKRELAFLKAGIDPEADKRLAYFRDSYKGDLTAEAIKAEATAAGFLSAAQDEAEDAIPADEIEAHKRSQGLSTGARPTGSYDFDAQIAEAEAAGDHFKVIALKQHRAAARTSRAS